MRRQRGCHINHAAFGMRQNETTREQMQLAFNLCGNGAQRIIATRIIIWSRPIFGIADDRMTNSLSMSAQLVADALMMAVWRRGRPQALLHHSDQGCTYASEDYRTRLEAHGIACSMSRRGNCHDNAVMESWFSTVKSEEGERFESYAHAKEALFDYIEVFYNQRRRHSTLGQISPAEFERRAGHAA